MAKKTWFECMNPQQLAKSDTEHAHQTALFAYVAVAYRCGFDQAELWVSGKKPRMPSEPAVPALEWFHAIPNGGSRGDSVRSRKIHGASLKAEGVRKGVADCFLPYPNAGMHGLYIEMKKPSQKPKRKGKGGLSEHQINFKNYVQSVDYGFLTCYSWREAAQLLRSYIEYKGA